MDEALEAKRSAHRFWSQTLELFIEKQVETDVLLYAMEFSNKIDKEILEKYGLEILEQSYLKEPR